MDIGVRELKQHLSDYLERAARGETVIVTDRGVPKAQIIAVPGAASLQRAAEEGWLRLPLDPAPLPQIPRVTSTRRKLEVLGEDRGE